MSPLAFVAIALLLVCLLTPQERPERRRERLAKQARVAEYQRRSRHYRRVRDREMDAQVDHLVDCFYADQWLFDGGEITRA